MPRVSGPIVDLLINDNQLVNAGELLFRINPRTLRSAVDQAQSGLHQAQVEAKNAK
jgi:membrane fusion protein (multidrug efflux system)